MGVRPPQLAASFVSRVSIHRLTDDRNRSRASVSLDAVTPNGAAKARAMAAVTAQSERLAIIAATELMYPHQFRANDQAEINSGKATLRKIALHFHVPEYVVGSALHPGRIELARMGWELANR